MTLPIIDANQQEQEIWERATKAMYKIEHGQEEKNTTANDNYRERETELLTVKNVSDYNLDGLSTPQKYDEGNNPNRSFLNSNSNDNSRGSSKDQEHVINTVNANSREENAENNNEKKINEEKTNHSPPSSVEKEKEKEKEENAKIEESSVNNDSTESNENSLKKITDVITDLVNELKVIRDKGVIQLTPTTIDFLALEDLDSKVAFLVANPDINLSFIVSINR